jgi:hypothetical protein
VGPDPLHTPRQTFCSQSLDGRLAFGSARRIGGTHRNRMGHLMSALGYDLGAEARNRPELSHAQK